MCSSHLSKVNYSYPDPVIKRYIDDLQGPPGYPDGKVRGKGGKIPLNIFLSQELQRMQNIILIVKKTFEDIIQAVEGQIIMTPQIVNSIDSLYDRRVPESWLYDSGRAEISWLKPSFNLWFSSFKERNNKLEEWMKGTRPKFFSLDNFFNPQGFLTSMKQEVVRVKKHNQKNRPGQIQENWSLDAVDYKIEVLPKSKDEKELESRRGPEGGGVWIKGLFIEGAQIKPDATITDAVGKTLIYNMPIVHVTAQSVGNVTSGKRNDDKKENEYSCPVYKYPKRTDQYIIFRIPLKCTGNNNEASKWKLGGVAILSSID